MKQILVIHLDMLKKVIYPFSYAAKNTIFSNLSPKTIPHFNFPLKKPPLIHTNIYNFSKGIKKNIQKGNKNSQALQEISQLYKKLGWGPNFKNQYTKLIAKYTTNGDMGNLIKLKQFRTIKDEQHNDQNNQSHLLELYQLAALYQTENKPQKIEFYFKKVYSLLKKYPGLQQVDQLNCIVEYMIGKHLFSISIQRRKQAKQWYQLFKQKISQDNISVINNDLRFYYYFQLAVIYLDMNMLQQSKQEFRKFCQVLEINQFQKISKSVILVALYEFAEVEFEKGDRKHALQVVKTLLSKIDMKDKQEMQYLDRCQLLIQQFAKQLNQSQEVLDKISSLKNGVTTATQNTQNTQPITNKKKSPIIPNIKQVESLWDDFSQDYNKFDYCPQTLYYSFLYMLEIWQGKNILQVACGTGKVLPMAVNMKHKSANYLAVDLSPQMIELTHTNLKKNLQLYDSKLTYEQWLKSNNIDIMIANGEQPIKKPEKYNQKFDRIICNCCLMLTENAEKMLTNLAKQAEKGCLLGVSVWGDKNNNNLMTSIRQSYIEAKVSLPEQRSNFHLYKKVSKLAQKCGWQTVLSWQQNALFPALSANSQKYNSFFFHQVNKVEQNKREQVKRILLKKLCKYFEQQKRGLNFSCEMFVLRKK